MRQKLSIDGLATVLDELGVHYFERDDSRQILTFSIGEEDDEHPVNFWLNIDQLGGVSVTSWSRSIDKSVLTAELGAQLLGLNSENKVGAVGLQDLGDEYRMWVDHYLAGRWDMVDLGVMEFVLFAILQAHGEAGQVLDDFTPKSEPIP